MPTTPLEIANRALDLLGQGALTSLEDPTQTAAIMSRNYPLSRDTVLRSYPWNSATRRAALPALAQAPAWGFARQFQLPADCLRVIESEGDLVEGVVWRREANRILTDAAAPLRIRYVARITDVSEMDAMLAEAIACHLASMVGYAIAGSNEAANRAFSLYERTVREARAMDARESSQDEELRADTWFNARY